MPIFHPSIVDIPHPFRYCGRVMRVSYHNHTCWSDGRNALEEMIAGARADGVDEFGIGEWENSEW